MKPCDVLGGAVLLRPMEYCVHHYEAFSPLPGRGNPAGVVLNGADLDEATMQAIAARVGFNETAFVLPSATGEVRLRYFTPGHEIDLCGHATVASLFALYDRKRLGVGEVMVETRAGLLPMAVRLEGAEVQIEMTQAPAQFVPFSGDRNAVASVLGISAADLDCNRPIVFGSTGTWTLLVPVQGVATLRAMRPQTAAFPRVLEPMPRASIHPFCFETDSVDANLSARHFSSPFSGTIEDPVTGTASGVMAAYMATYAAPWMADRCGSIVVEQGKDVGRDGRVHIRLLNRQRPFQVRIAGTACYVRDLTIEV
jgi:PhzF family phenazine biosynthesis protein